MTLNRVLARVFSPWRRISRRITELSAFHLRWALWLTSVPLVSSAILILLLLVFAKLNLFMLEGSGLMIDERMREAYFDTISIEMSSDLILVALLVLLTFAISWVVARWSTSPFRDADKLIWTALHEPANLKVPRKWLSESPEFEALLNNHAEQVAGKAPPAWKGRLPVITFTPLFSIKFLLIYIPLSVVNGFFLGNVLTSAYTRIVSLAVSLSKNPQAAQHFFISQQEILMDATVLVSSFALMAYLLMGMSMARYMSTMVFVFARGIVEHRFPLRLRNSDIYNSLAQTLNEANTRLNERQRATSSEDNEKP